MKRFLYVLLFMAILTAVPSLHAADPSTDDLRKAAKNLMADLKNAPLLAMTGGAVAAKDVITEDKEGEMSVEQIAELMANPFSHLWFGMIQNDTYWWNGDLLDSLNEDTKVMNTTVLQPVMSMQLTEEWKMIFRPVIPIQSFDTISGFDIIEDESEGITSTTFDRETGLGDILLWSAFTNHYKPPFVWGFGPTIMMDTASDDTLGTGKWSAGSHGTCG